jgi:hypothetical protein
MDAINCLLAQLARCTIGYRKSSTDARICQYYSFADFGPEDPRQIALKSCKFSHSEMIVGCTAPMDAINCLLAQLARCTIGYRKSSTDARICLY